MNTKICLNCHNKKDVNEFIRNGKERKQCNSCAEYNKKYYQTHKDIKRQYTKTHKKLITSESRVINFIRLYARELKPYKNDLKEMLNIKHCPICGVEFEKNGNNSNPSFDHIIPGKQELSNIHIICKRCNAIKYNLTLDELRMLAEDDSKIGEVVKLETVGIDLKRLKTIYIEKKHKAKQKGIEFNLTIDDFLGMIVIYCPIFGIKLNYKSGTKTPQENSFSLDRIDPKKGYIVGNCRIISKRANRAKLDAYPEEIEKIYLYIKRILA